MPGQAFQDILPHASSAWIASNPSHNNNLKLNLKSNLSMFSLLSALDSKTGGGRCVAPFLCPQWFFMLSFNVVLYWYDYACISIIWCGAGGRETVNFLNDSPHFKGRLFATKSFIFEFWLKFPASCSKTFSQLTIVIQMQNHNKGQKFTIYRSLQWATSPFPWKFLPINTLKRGKEVVFEIKFQTFWWLATKTLLLWDTLKIIPLILLLDII